MGGLTSAVPMAGLPGLYNLGNAFCPTLWMGRLRNDSGTVCASLAAREGGLAEELKWQCGGRGIGYFTSK